MEPQQAVHFGAFSANRASEGPKTSVIGELVVLSRQLQVTSVDGPRYTAAGGVGWLRSFVRESVAEAGDTAAGGSKVDIPYHHSR